MRGNKFQPLRFKSKINRAEGGIDVRTVGNSRVGSRPNHHACYAAVFVGQLSTPASARVAENNASKLLSDDDFVDGLTKLVRKTVRDYCTVGKRGGIDC
jgi:hypothetical protein